jgi:hypothetical protein
MGLDKNLSDALGIDHDAPVETKQEIIPYEEPSSDLSDQEEDYILARKVLRNLIEKGNDAIDEISTIARQNESARGFEVVSTLIKTVGDTTKDLYNLQKMTKDLKEPPKNSDPRAKNPDAGNINVEQAVFVGSAAELLSAIKKQKEENGEITVHLPE